MKHIAAFSPVGLRRAGRLALAGMLALGVSACSLLPKAEPLVRYELPAAKVAAMTSIPLPLTLALTTPMSSQALNTDRILVMPDGNELSAYKGVRWSDPAPLALRNQMVLALRDSGLVRMVAPYMAGLRSEAVLSSDLSAFQVRYVDGAPVVQVRIDMALIRTATGKPVSTQRFAVDQPASGTDVAQVVRAYGQAVQTLNRQMLDWLAPALREVAESRAGAAK